MGMETGFPLMPFQII